MTTHSAIYEAAALYDLAFSYRDFGAEARFLRELYQRRRGDGASSFLELAAGPAEHAVQMLQAGLYARALDLSPHMADYGRRKAAARGQTLDYVVGDMTRFETPRPFELIACLLCSASYLLTDSDFLLHLSSVHAALAPRGIYVLELSHPSELTSERKSNSTWKMHDARGELDILWGGEPSQSVNGIWTADVIIRYRPFDGSAPVELRDRAQQRGYTLDDISRLAQQSGFSISAALGAFDEQVLLDDPRAQRMILALERL